MSSLQRLILTVPETATQFASNAQLINGSTHIGLIGLANYLRSIAGGDRLGGKVVVQSGAVQATATLTSTGAATADETCVVCGVTLTAKNSGTAADTFVVSGTVATQAANIAACINASTGLVGIVTATASLGVVTITAVAPGAMGNGLQISESLTNVSLSSFATLATGSDGTTYTLDLS